MSPRSMPRSPYPGATASAGQQDPVPRREAGGPRDGLARLLSGVGLAVVMLILGVVAKTGPVTRFDLSVDQHIAAHDRTGALTALARAATTVATPETVGVGLAIVVPVILLLMRRRLDALKALCMFVGAAALAEIGKKLISEHRPPVSLWAMKADSGASYPSGHATIAAALAVTLIVVASTVAGRRAAIVLGVLYAVVVAASRVYLADHYLLDVLGSMLCALAAGLVVTGLAALPALQPWLGRLAASGGRHR
jgi:membrane-associated phospholipid phosphatase